MKVSDLVKLAVFGRLLVGYVAAVFAGWSALTFASTLGCIGDCPAFVLPGGRWWWFPSELSTWLEIPIYTIAFAIPAAIAVAVFVVLRAQSVWAFVLLSALGLGVDWINHAEFAGLMLDNFLRNSAEESMRQLVLAWLIWEVAIATGYIAPSLIFYYFGWRPAWRAAEASA